MSSDSSETLVPQMGAEGGYGLDDSVVPLRLSGFLCLMLGLLSVIAFLAPMLVVVPVIAILLGVFALRRHGERVPLGVGAARVGLVLAVGFGSFGYFIHAMKHTTLGDQAERFGRDYIEVVALDQVELAKELQKDYVNRFPTSMPLAAHYSLNEQAEESLFEFRDNSVNTMILNRGPNAEWGLGGRIEVASHFGAQRVHLLWVDPTGKHPVRLRMSLEYRISRRSGDGQWHVALVYLDRERIVAPMVL